MPASRASVRSTRKQCAGLETLNNNNYQSLLFQPQHGGFIPTRTGLPNCRLPLPCPP